MVVCVTLARFYVTLRIVKADVHRISLSCVSRVIKTIKCLNICISTRQLGDASFYEISRFPYVIRAIVSITCILNYIDIDNTLDKTKTVDPCRFKAS